jgi:hypothetical protein
MVGLDADIFPIFLKLENLSLKWPEKNSAFVRMFNIYNYKAGIVGLS